MKKSISCLLALTIISSTPACANPELSADALEHVFFELHETLSQLWANDTVRTSTIALGLAAGMAYVYSRSQSGEETSSTSKARTRYAGLMKRKQEVAQQRAQENRKLAAMQAQLGIAQDEEQEVYAYPGAKPQTRNMLASSLAQLLPQFIVSEEKEEEQDGVTISGSHLKGAVVGASAGVLLMLLYYGRPLKNGMVLEKLRSLMPTGLVDMAESVPIVGWPVKIVRTLLTTL